MNQITQVNVVWVIVWFLWLQAKLWPVLHKCIVWLMKNANVCYCQPTDLLVGSLDVKQQGIALNGCWANCVSLTFTSHMILTLDFQGQILKQPYLRNAKTDWPRMKGCESIGYWTDCVTLSCDLNFGYARSNFEKAVSQEWDGRLTWNEGMWVDRKSDPLCDFIPWPHPWPWSWIFMVKFWKSHIPGMARSIDMERKGIDESYKCRCP